MPRLPRARVAGSSSTSPHQVLRPNRRSSPELIAWKRESAKSRYGGGSQRVKPARDRLNGFDLGASCAEPLRANARTKSALSAWGLCALGDIVI